MHCGSELTSFMWYSLAVHNQYYSGRTQFLWAFPMDQHERLELHIILSISMTKTFKISLYWLDHTGHEWTPITCSVVTGLVMHLSVSLIRRQCSAVTSVSTCRGGGGAQGAPAPPSSAAISPSCRVSTTTHCLKINNGRNPIKCTVVYIKHASQA